MRSMIIAAAVAGLMAATSTAAFANCDAGEIIIKFSHDANADKHPKGIAATLLAKRVNEEMNGKACMEIYPNSSLYGDKKVLEAMLNGDVQLAAPSLSKFEKFTSKFRIFDLPFLFNDINAVERFQKSAGGEKLKNSMINSGLKGLAFWHGGMKQISANKPLIYPEDAKGLKFRVQTLDVLIAQFEQLGASTQKMDFKDVFDGLKTKVIDGQENTWSNIYRKKFFEVQDGVTETNHGIIDYLVVTSTKWWDELKPDVRDQFAKILSEVSDTRNAASKAVNKASKRKVMAAGSPVRVLTADQRDAWIAALKPVWAKFEGDIGADTIASAQAANGGS